MKVINRYVLKSFIKYLFICLAVLIFIYIVINLFDNLGKFLAKDALAKDILIYYLYLTPSYIVLLIPVASIMAVFFIFGIMTKNKELVALKTCGLNTNRLFYLILSAGFVICLLSFAFQETVGVWSQARLFAHQQEKIDKRPKRPQSTRSNFFYHGEDDWVYFIKRFDASTQRINVVILWQISRENKIKKRIDADAAIYDGSWKFSEAIFRDFDDEGNETVKAYKVLEMPELKERPEDFLKRKKPLEEMNFMEIYRFVQKRARAGENVAKEEVELNYRFSYPLITIIILLITLPLSVVLKKGGVAIGLGISIALAFTYWGLIQSCRAYGVAGLMDPLLAAWFPNMLFGIVGIVLIFKVPR
jgi:lipopolysaccharide export system permease protein